MSLHRLGLAAGGIAILAAATIRIHIPLRAHRLSESYAAFRTESQPVHDAIDARFNHQDRMVDGLRWHYVDEGARDGQAVLFLHGLPEGWYAWHKVLPRIDHNYRLIALDMKGYGRSDRHHGDYDWHVVARQTFALMESLGIDRFYVVSHDWGSLIGSVLVSDHPEHILGFVRMQADLLPKDNRRMLAALIHKPQWLFFQNESLATYVMQDAGPFIDAVYGSRMTTRLEQADRDYLVYEFSRPGVAAAMARYFQTSNWDLDAAIDKICTNQFPFPVLQLQADRDPAQPPSMFADVAGECPNVQIEWITDASHFDNFDQPAQVAEAINRFLHAAAE